MLHFLEASCCFFVGHLRSFSLFLLVVFSLFLSAVSEASLYFVGCLFAVVIGRLGSFSSTILEAFCCFCRLSRKLLVVLVCRLGSFLLFSLAVLEASRCFSLPFLLFCSQPFSCCFSQPLLLFSGRSSRCFSSLFFSFFFSKNFFLAFRF